MGSNPTALITGSARRIGAEIARHLHARGLDVLIHCRNSLEEARALAGELDATRAGSAQVLQADLDDPQAVRALAAKTLAATDRLTLLVNNASSFYATPVGQASDADWEALLHSNLRAPWILVQELAGALQDAGGSVVNIVDIYAAHPLAEHSLYCMAKAGLAMMTRSLARELAPGVRVNGVSPGPILWPESDGPDREAMLNAMPLGRCGEPGDIAGAAAWLGLDAPFVTGQILAVDGGRSLVLEGS